MSRDVGRRTFLVAGGISAGAAMMGLPAAPAGAAQTAQAGGGQDGAGSAATGATTADAAAFAPAPDFGFRDDTVAAGTRIDEIVSLLTLEEKVAVATGGSSAAVPRIGLNPGRFPGGEALHGVVGGYATVFPAPRGGSQSWDCDLFHAIGDIIATESLAGNGGVGRLAPVMDLLHDPRAGRNYETMGEDAYLSGALGMAMTSGMNQRTADGYQKFLPILKHFFGYNNEINRLWTNTVMPPRVANEYYARVFRYPIGAGTAKSVMSSYPLINGKPMPVNPFMAQMLTQWTPDYEGTGHFEFRTINDFGAGSSLWVHSQRYFPDDPDGRAFGMAQATRTGQMSWSFRNYGDPTSVLYDALARGIITEADLDANVRRNLSLSLRTGDFDQLRIRSPYIAATGVTVASLLPGHRAVALQAAQEQITLLKNDGAALPLPGPATSDVVLIGSLAEEVLKDYYTGNFVYDITITDALSNKLGASHVHYTRAVDTVAIKASNGKYLVSAANAFSEPGSASASDTAVLAAGTAQADNDVQLSETPLLFEQYIYGGLDQAIRTPVNDRFVQVPHLLTSPAFKGTLINNTSAPGEGSFNTGALQYVNYQKLRIVPAAGGKTGIYAPVAGDGGNNSYGQSAMAYDQDDEDVNNGSYLRLITSGAQAGQIVADATQGHVGPYRNEDHTAGPDITQAPFDRSGADAVADSLPDEYTFEFQNVQTSLQAIDAALAAAPADAPVLLVVGYEPHINSREAVDLESTGLGELHTRNLNYLTATLGRDVILIVKTGSPMTIDESVHANPHVTAIVEIGHSSQEEGSALVSALFDDGYSVPADGWAPTNDRYSPFAAYTAYPGYLPVPGGIPACAPAGRLTATWHKAVSDLPGASDDHPPSSYRWPAYDEDSNDNLSNLNGTVPTGLLTYDIIKGQRTYQYFQGTPLYAFGYGLTYTTFRYGPVTITRAEHGTVTVSGSVTNTGTITSDEVVQVYSRFTGPASRITQPGSRLIAFDRLKGIRPGESRSYSFETDLADKLGVWDVETGRFIVEPGSYTIRAARSSADTGATATLTVTAADGAARAATRNLRRQVQAETFDDYSDLGGRIADIELVSASTAADSATAVSFRHDGAWIVFKDVRLPDGTTALTLRAGSDRTGAVSVYAVPAGMPLTGAARPLTTFSLTDTRPVQGLPAGLGIGPIAVTGQPFGNSPYPGSPVGQNGLDATGQPYKNAYIRPAFANLAQPVSVRPGSYDIYLVSSRRGSRLEWLQFGAAADVTRQVAVTQREQLSSVRAKGGTLQLTASLTPVTSVSPVTWAVSAPGGGATSLATIDAGTGLLTATGQGNGTVMVTATSGGRQARARILVTNQLDANTVTVSGAPVTVDYISLRTGAAFGPTDSIQRFGGTSQQTAVFGGLFADSPDGYYLPGSYQTLPASALSWSVTDLHGNPTNLAAIDQAGLVTAAGTGDGDVRVTATLTSNPDITGTRVIAVRNQGTKNPFRMIQAANYDAASATATAASAWGFGGNQFGIQVPMPAASTWTYKNVAFGSHAPATAGIRLAAGAATVTTVTVQIWADAAGTAAGGTLVATISAATNGSTVTYSTATAPVTTQLTGTHDIIVQPSDAVRVNWFAFA